jgi:hypothetical protein
MSDQRTVPEQLRSIAGSTASRYGWSDDDIALVSDAADMLELFFGQMRTTDVKMDGRHHYRLSPSGWPMTHCVGPNAEAAVRAAIAEVKRERGDG